MFRPTWHKLTAATAERCNEVEYLERFYSLLADGIFFCPKNFNIFRDVFYLILFISYFYYVQP